MNLGKYEFNTITIGDARHLAKDIPDESVDLIFTDPVYWQIDDYLWLSFLGQRILKQDRSCLMWQGQQWLHQTYTALSAGPLKYRFELNWYASNNMQMVGKIGRKNVPLLWYEKGNAKINGFVREVYESAIPNKKPPHHWAKKPDVIVYFLTKFSKPGDIVLDPFSGGGGILEACKITGRNYVGFELLEKTALSSRKRLSLVMEPLVTEAAEQPLALDGGDSPALPGFIYPEGFTGQDGLS